MIVGFWRMLVCALTLCVVTWPAYARQLLSIEGISLAPSEYVSAFEIKIWGFRVIAVCKVPRGWGISVSQSANPEGILTGLAGHGVAFADAEDVKRRFLHLFLTDDPDEVSFSARGSVPPTFDGRIAVGMYGLNRREVWRHLKPLNYVLTPANLCPDSDQ